VQRSPTDVTEHLCPLCNGRRKNARAGKLVVQKLATEGEGQSVRWQGDDRNSNDHNRYLWILALLRIHPQIVLDRSWSLLNFESNVVEINSFPDTNPPKQFCQRAFGWACFACCPANVKIQGPSNE